MKRLLLGVLVIVLAIPLLGVLYYAVDDLLRLRGRVHVKDDFYIEYLDMYSSFSLWNGNQGFVGNVSSAYWNNDSLVVAGGKGCFLIEFGKTKYNDEMIPIDCDYLARIIQKPPIKTYFAK